MTLVACPRWRLCCKAYGRPAGSRCGGTRGAFDYSFSQQLDKQFAGLKMPNGFFCDDEFTDVDQPAALMRAMASRVFSITVAMWCALA